VAGFLPFLGAFSFTQNLPNPEIIISSPDARVDFIISSRDSIVFFASTGVWLFFSEIFSMIVCLVSANLGAVLFEVTVFIVEAIAISECCQEIGLGVGQTPQYYK